MTTLSLTAGILPAQSLSRSQWRVVSLASLGGSLEYYDFIIYSIFAQYIARQFFPTIDPFVSLILAFSVLTLGFLARPLGGIVLSWLGDRYGVEVTSTYGTGLEKAVEAFQRHFRPARVDGRADLSTRDTLVRLLAARSGGA